MNGDRDRAINAKKAAQAADTWLQHSAKLAEDRGVSLDTALSAMNTVVIVHALFTIAEKIR
jgi:hypothetical protein